LNSKCHFDAAAAAAAGSRQQLNVNAAKSLQLLQPIATPTIKRLQRATS